MTVSALRRIIVVCEGQTEEAFINTVVAPAFYSIGIHLMPQLINTSPGNRGGALSYDRIKRFLRNTLRSSTQPFVTTLFDLYQLDGSFPGYAEAAGKPLHQRLRILTTALYDDIVAYTGCQNDRFLPYVQPYEFEALLFSDVDTITSLETSWANAQPALQQIWDGAESPEHINDGATTHPAARLKAHLTSPTYRKTLHGPIAAEYITLARIESECRYFAGWLEQLRLLSPVPRMEPEP